jgi:hypothetical protein
MLLLDQNGLVRWMSNGIVSDDALTRLIDELLAEAGKPAEKEQAAN